MTLLRISHLITIEQQPTDAMPNRDKTYFFDIINKITVKKSFEDLTKTAEVILPRNLKYKNLNIYQGPNPVVLRGDKITIQAGYFPNLTTIFKGYISRVSDSIPIELKCEDQMWILKQIASPNLSYKDVSLDQLLSDMFKNLDYNVDYEAIGARLGMVRINSASISKVLNDVLKVGLPYYAPKRNETFLFEKHIIENDLQYLRSEDVKIKIKGVLIKDNSKEEIFVGSEDGDLRTVFQYGGTIEELRRLCNTYLTNYNYTGYHGSLTTFLEPYIEPGDYATLASYQVPDRKGTYIVKSNEITISPEEGGRQKIELEQRVS